jgi:hypothetical protein
LFVGSARTRTFSKQAEQHYVDTTLGVLVAVVKASGYALLACLGLGGLAGALLFARRRAQTSEAVFSDAGGMLRLNLDELTPETNPARLLETGTKTQIYADTKNAGC